MQRRELDERTLDDALRTALVVDPPAELQQRLIAIAHAAARPQAAVAPAPAPFGFLREPSTWLCALALALVGVRLYDLLLGAGVVLGDLVEASRVLVSVADLPTIASLTVDPLLLALWLGVGVVAWLVAERRDAFSRPDAA